MPERPVGGGRLAEATSTGMTVPRAERDPEQLLSVVTPAFQEAKNLPVLYRRLKTVLEGLGMPWEWVIVDDHSPDATYETVCELAGRDKRVRGLKLARNCGAHIALTCALHAARGDCAVAIAGDLQDPPEVIPRLVEAWLSGVHVVWAAREQRQGEGAAKVGTARLYYWLMRNVVGFREMPAEGADFFLVDRQVLDAFRQFNESNVSILALITWMGFRQSVIAYTKEARLHGASGWTLKKKLKLLVDSVTSFSYAPIRLMSYFGFAVASAGFLYSVFLVQNALRGAPPAGWTTLMVLVLMLGGIQMTMLGVLGEYLWRSLDEARRRPRYLIQDSTEQAEENRARISIGGPRCLADSTGPPAKVK